MKLSTELRTFSDRLGYHFKDPSLLIEATTHPSFSSVTRRDNQRLEFLGDRVLGLVIAQYLLEENKTADEGKLAPHFNALVRKEACATVATQIDLGTALKMGRSEMRSGGRRKQTILGDAMESVIAAVFIDADFATARDVILRLWAPLFEQTTDDVVDAKTKLQEWAQARKMAVPNYIDVERSGPDHAPQFTVRVELEDGQMAEARANSKRQAQQLAAGAVLDQLENADV